ncbi:hypothetical protein D3C76_1319730 [compost metagenome]
MVCVKLLLELLGVSEKLLLDVDAGEFCELTVAAPKSRAGFSASLILLLLNP